MKKTMRIMAAIMATAVVSGSVLGSVSSTTASAKHSVTSSSSTTGTLSVGDIEVTMAELKVNNYQVEVPVTTDVATYTFGFGVNFDSDLTYVGSLQRSFPVVHEDGRLWTTGYYMNAVQPGSTVTTLVFQLDKNAEIGDVYDIELTGENYNGETAAVINEDTPNLESGTITVVKSSETSTVLMGDVNQDGKVDAIDAFLVLTESASRSVSGKGVFDDTQFYLGDVDGNGTLNSVDSYYILMYSALSAVKSGITMDYVVANY